MPSLAAEQELYRACKVIFGPDLDLSRGFLQYLQLSGVKSAYRKRAFETHPDRFAALANAADEYKNGLLFHDVRQAYENLVNYLQAREEGGRLTGGPRWQPEMSGRQPPFRPKRAETTGTGFATDNGYRRQRRPDGTASRSSLWNLDELYRGPVPDRRLLLGHFLYYSGLASWRTIVQALIWQRNQRPRLGEISRRYGLLDAAAIELVLKNRQKLQPFGQSALALGLLSEAQLRLLLQAQKRLQRKFGEYFIEQGLLLPGRLERLLREHHAHNTRLARKSAGRHPGF